MYHGLESFQGQGRRPTVVAAALALTFGLTPGNAAIYD